MKLNFLNLIIGLSGLLLLELAHGQCPTLNPDGPEFNEYTQPAENPLTLLRIGGSGVHPDFLSLDMLRFVMATIDENQNQFNLDETFRYPSLFRASGYRRLMCKQRRTEKEITEYNRENNLLEVERQERRFSQKIIEGFIQGTLEPSVGQSVGGNPSLIFGFNYNPSQGTFEEIARGSVSTGAAIPMTREELQQRFISIIHQYIPPEQRNMFGTLQRVETMQEAGEQIVTRIHFSKITFNKPYGTSVFTANLADGREVELYCGSDDLE